MRRNYTFCNNRIGTAKGSIDDIVDSVTNAEKVIKKKQLSIYLDEDVAKELDKFAKKHSKGAKSNLINNFLKIVFNIER